MTEEGIRRIADAFITGTPIPGFLNVVTNEQVGASDWNLSPSLHVAQKSNSEVRPLSEIIAEIRVLDEEAARVSRQLESVLTPLTERPE